MGYTLSLPAVMHRLHKAALGLCTFLLCRQFFCSWPLLVVDNHGADRYNRRWFLPCRAATLGDLRVLGPLAAVCRVAAR
jgi:hypothetical protein